MNIPAHKHETHQPTKETARLEAFSDGVFAIAITLLVIELIQLVQDKEQEDLLTMLIHHWASLFAFGFGFVSIFICWINHHVVFDYIIKTNSKLMWVNAFVLLVVTFTPFAITVLAKYFNSERNRAMAFFGFDYLLMSFAAYLLCAYVYKRSLVDENYRKTFHRLLKLYEYSVYYTFIAFLVCFFSVAVAITLYCLLFVVFAFPRASALKLIRGK